MTDQEVNAVLDSVDALIQNEEVNETINNNKQLSERVDQIMHKIIELGKNKPPRNIPSWTCLEKLDSNV